MTRKAPWTKVFEGHGIYNYVLAEWGHFHSLLNEELPNPKTFIWRGQRCSDWPLKTTLQRALDHLPEDDQDSAAQQHLESFQYAARGRRGPNPTELKEDNWWALGQHYGLATPLLDWTLSPFAAAFFAFCTRGTPQAPNRAIYAFSVAAAASGARILAKEHFKINCSSRIGRLWGEADSGNGDPIDSESPTQKRERLIQESLKRHHHVSVIHPLSDENPRLVNQAGLFTKIPLQISLCDWICEVFPKSTRREILIKIKIPDADRAACLRDLNRMNINHLTLFPDLEGASKFANTHLEISQY